MNLSILVVAPIGSNSASGLYYSCPKLTLALYKVNAKVALITTGISGRYNIPQPYPVFYYRDIAQFNFPTYLPAPFNNPDLVVFNSTYILAHAQFAKCARSQGIPYVITPRGGMTVEAQKRKRLKKILGNLLFYKNMVTHCASIHCLSENEAREVVKWKRPVFVVGNGIDIPEKEKTPISPVCEGLRFVFIGRLDIYAKGLDLLLKGCSICANTLSLQKVKLFLYGPHDHGSWSQIWRMIQELQLEGIVALPGPVFGGDKEVVLQQTDVFVHTSRFEGHPMAVLEALAYGIPCLLTPGTNMSKEVAAAGAGWEVTGSAEGIAEGLLQVIRNQHELQERGRAARELAKTHYSWNQIATQLMNEYSKLIGK